MNLKNMRKKNKNLKDVRIRVSRLTLFLVFARGILKNDLKEIERLRNARAKRNKGDTDVIMVLRAWIKEAEILALTLIPVEGKYLVTEKEDCDLCYKGNCSHKCHSKNEKEK